MDPLIGGLVAGGINALGGLFSQTSARSAYQHRYQDTVADMRKAGLNPALAYGQNPGGGAQTHDFGSLGSEAASATQTMAAAKQAKANRDLTVAQTDLLKAQTADLALRPGLENARIASDTHVADKTAVLRAWQADSAKSQAWVDRNTQDTKISQQQLNLLLSQLGLPQAKATAKFFQQTGPLAKYLNSAAVLAAILGKAR